MALTIALDDDQALPHGGGIVAAGWVAVGVGSDGGADSPFVPTRTT
jgi:hypothetical protein